MNELSIEQLLAWLRDKARWAASELHTVDARLSQAAELIEKAYATTARIA